MGSCQGLRVGLGDCPQVGGPLYTRCCLPFFSSWAQVLPPALRVGVGDMASSDLGYLFMPGTVSVSLEQEAGDPEGTVSGELSG